jgi:hypothetical protein
MHCIRIALLKSAHSKLVRRRQRRPASSREAISTIQTLRAALRPQPFRFEHCAVGKTG